MRCVSFNSIVQIDNTLCRLPRKVWLPTFLPFPFNLETSPFGLVNDLVPNCGFTSMCTLWSLNSNLEPWEPKNGICSSCNFYTSCDIDQKFYAELKNVYFMGSEIKPLCLCYVLWIESLLAGTQHIFFVIDFVHLRLAKKTVYPSQKVFICQKKLQVKWNEMLFKTKIESVM
jgi:hypothetical protein